MKTRPGAEREEFTSYPECFKTCLRRVEVKWQRATDFTKVNGMMVTLTLSASGILNIITF